MSDNFSTCSESIAVEFVDDTDVCTTPVEIVPAEAREESVGFAMDQPSEDVDVGHETVQDVGVVRRSRHTGTTLPPPSTIASPRRGEGVPQLGYTSNMSIVQSLPPSLPLPLGLPSAPPPPPSPLTTTDATTDRQTLPGGTNRDPSSTPLTSYPGGYLGDPQTVSIPPWTGGGASSGYNRPPPPTQPTPIYGIPVMGIPLPSAHNNHLSNMDGSVQQPTTYPMDVDPRLDVPPPPPGMVYVANPEDLLPEDNVTLVRKQRRAAMFYAVAEFIVTGVFGIYSYYLALVLLVFPILGLFGAIYLRRPLITIFLCYFPFILALRGYIVYSVLEDEDVDSTYFKAQVIVAGVGAAAELYMAFVIYCFRRTLYKCPMEMLAALRPRACCAS